MSDSELLFVLVKEGFVGEARELVLTRSWSHNERGRINVLKRSTFSQENDLLVVGCGVFVREDYSLFVLVLPFSLLQFHKEIILENSEQSILKIVHISEHINILPQYPLIYFLTLFATHKVILFFLVLSLQQIRIRVADIEPFTVPQVLLFLLLLSFECNKLSDLRVDDGIDGG